MARHGNRSGIRNYLALTILLGAGFFAYSLLGADPSVRGHGPEDAPPGLALAAASLALPQREVAAKGAPGVLPRSLQGTEIDGDLFASADGRLVVGPGLRALFDYFLTTSGEEPLPAIRARIIAALRSRLGPEAAQEAIALLDRYLEYRERAGALLETGEIPTDLEGRFAALKALRRQVLGEEDAAALFGEEEAADAAALALRSLVTDLSLPPKEWDRRRAELEEKLPKEVKLARDEATAPLRLAQEEDILRQEGASDEEIRALRVSYFGAEAADRLETLDEERRAWEERLALFRAARAEILADTSRSAAAKADAIQNLLEESFTPKEQRRVLALDRM